MNKVPVLKLVAKVDVLIIALDITILMIFFTLNQGFSWVKFLFSLFVMLMLEGMVAVLIGCLGYFGFEKYTIWLGRKVIQGQKQGKKRKEGDFRLLLILSGLLLFIIGFILSFLFS